jgi:type 1 glutamine amidotransferase
MTDQSACPHVVFVAGEDEYCSHVSFAYLARSVREELGLRTTNLSTFPDPGSLSNLPGLEALAEADLALFYIRFLAIPAEQLDHIKAYVRSGKPMICFRTTTHGFRYPDGHALAPWNAEWPKMPGAPWITHYGHESSTDVWVPEGASDNPILAGVEPRFHVRSWLYEVVPNYPPSDATILLMGKSIGRGHPESPEDRPLNPVAWTHTHPWGGRVFTTTMGHPEDFLAPPVHRLVTNAIRWALGLPIPAAE